MVPRKGDIFVAELEGLRLRLEELIVGDFDSRGEIITQTYYDGLMRSVLKSVKEELVDDTETPPLMRLTKLNGLQIDNSTMVWVYGGSGLLANSDSVGTVGRNLLLNGKIVENMLVL